MKKIVHIIFLFLIFSAELKSQVYQDAGGNKYILIDKDFIRGDIAVTQMTLKFNGIPMRVGNGVHTKLAGGIISSFVKKEHAIAFYDEFYCNVSIGKLASAPLYYFASPEFKLTTSFMFGYEILMGYNTPKFAVLGGVRFQWANAFIGSSELTGDKLLCGTHPFMLRTEYKINGSPYRKFVLMAWSNFNSLKNNSGFNLDIPVSKKKRLWITFQYEYLTYPSSSPANYGNNQYTAGVFNQFFAGIKVGSLH